ncbi:MAG: hypothetical protein H0X15_00670 [Acidobacteria bacterium]|jgi:hypothetical protein|nr:hypothetical protein [Acidobacteriota bacterium]MBA4124978.1 hypothetical protein [Acidobacteriota bacterium]MBA4183286.1 hypothetical protein [Acidobacteriota bacterium]HEV8159256.1 hypothetical protein [Pyrinomonadaceae bacterium]
MTITIDLPSEVETKIKAQASNDGVKVEDYVKILIKEASDRREQSEKASEKTFREILAPVHKGFTESGMSEDEIIQMFEEAREEVWQEKQNSK